MTSLTIDSAATMQLTVRTGLRGASQAAIKWRMAVMYTSLREIKMPWVWGREQWVYGNSQFRQSASRMANSELEAVCRQNQLLNPFAYAYTG